MTYKKIIYSFLVLIMFAIPVLFWPNFIQSFGSPVWHQAIAISYKVFGVGIWLSLAWFVSSCIDFFIWGKIVEPRIGSRVPSLLKLIADVIIYFTAIVALAKVVFDEDVTGLLATFSVASFAIGFALKDVIASVFSGIFLNLDKTYRIGEMIQIMGNINQTAVVQEITWRSTYLKRSDNTILIIPNGILSIIPIINYSRAKNINADFDFTVKAKSPISISRLSRLLNKLVKSQDYLLTPNEARASFKGYGNTRSDYIFNVQYSTDIKSLSVSKARRLISRNIIKYLEGEGIVHEENLSEVWTWSEQFQNILNQIPFFAGLNEANKKILYENAKCQLYDEDSTIIEKGQSGQSMFVVIDGLLGVYIDYEHRGKASKVADLSDGQFFGEMSLLTGEPRSATIRSLTDSILYEIDNEALAPILKENPKVAMQISEIMAERILQNQHLLDELSEQDLANHKENFAAKMFENIKHFFKL